MPPKKPNDEFDLSEFEDLLRPHKAPESAGFDLPEFSLDDLDLFLETELPEEKTEESLDLDSFLKFYDEPLEPETAAEAEPEPIVEEEAKAAPEPEAVPEKKSRRRRKPAADEAEPEAAEEPGEPLAAEADADEEPEEEYEERPRFSLGALFGRRREEEDEIPEDELDEAGEDGYDEAEEEARPRFSLAGLFGRRGAEEADANEEPEEDDDERPRFSLSALFGKKNAEEDDGEASAAEAEEEASVPGKPGKLSADKEKLFAMLYPRKNNGEKAADKAEEESEKAEGGDAPESKAVQVIPTAVVSQGPAWQDLPREPKAGEMLVLDSELDEIDYYDGEDLPEIRDYMPVRFARYGRLGIGGGIMYALFVISVSVILACAGWLFASDVLALNKPDTTSIVTILRYVPGPEDVFNEDGEPVDEEGNVIQVDIDQVASALKSSGVIDYKWLFKLFAELSTAHAKIDPGTYDVSAKLDYRALVTEMQTGSESQEITRITIPEGYSMEQIFQLLEDNGICDKEDLYEAAASYDFSYDWLEDQPLGDATRLEGYLFPDTYDFYQGESAVNAIDRFLNRFHYILTMDMYKQAENLGISLHEAVIIASLIEKEAGAEDDRSLFASVIYNRLDDGWKLQLDSTLNYIKGTSTFDLTYDDMEIDSPYNTYLYEGLPAGPICSPGKASLEAALNPSSTNYWYWYAYEGVTYFFSSGSAFDEFAAAHPY